MAPSCGTTCVKYIIFFCNFIFLILGLTLVTMAAKKMISSDLFWSEEPSSHFLYTAIALGTIISMLAFFGCCGVIQESYCMIFTFAVLLIFIFVVEVVLGIAGYLIMNEATVTKPFKVSMREYYEGNLMQQRRVDDFQITHECCGLYSPQEWLHQDSERYEYPKSCCRNCSPSDDCRLNSPSLCTDGCYYRVVAEFKIAALLLGALIVIQVTAATLACVLASSVRYPGRVEQVPLHDYS